MGKSRIGRFLRTRRLEIIEDILDETNINECVYAHFVVEIRPLGDDRPFSDFLEECPACMEPIMAIQYRAVPPTAEHLASKAAMKDYYAANNIGPQRGETVVLT